MFYFCIINIYQYYFVDEGVTQHFLGYGCTAVKINLSTYNILTQNGTNALTCYQKLLLFMRNMDKMHANFSEMFASFFYISIDPSCDCFFKSCGSNWRVDMISNTYVVNVVTLNNTSLKM